MYAIFLHGKHSTFCNVQYILFMFSSIFATECNLFYRRYELADFTFLNNSKLAIFNFFLQLARCKGATKYDIARVLGNINEATAPGYTRAKFRYVNITIAIAFSKAETRKVKATAIIEVELDSLIHIGFCIDRCTKTYTAERYTANSAGFNCHRKAIANTFFIGNRRNEFRNTNTKVNDSFIAKG